MRCRVGLVGCVNRAKIAATGVDAVSAVMLSGKIVVEVMSDLRHLLQGRYKTRELLENIVFMQDREVGIL